jgi:hypothetical protein
MRKATRLFRLFVISLQSVIRTYHPSDHTGITAQMGKKSIVSKESSEKKMFTTKAQNH